MRTTEEIQHEIDVLTFSKNEFRKKQEEFEWTTEESKYGAPLFNMYADSEKRIQERIILLEWVLGKREISY